MKSPEPEYVQPKRRVGPTPKESAALVVFRCFLNDLAADHNMPLRMLIPNDSMLHLLRGHFKDIESLAESGILEPRTLELVGEELVKILNGRRALRIVDGVATQQEV